MSRKGSPNRQIVYLAQLDQKTAFQSLPQTFGLGLEGLDQDPPLSGFCTEPISGQAVGSGHAICVCLAEKD